MYMIDLISSIRPVRLISHVFLRYYQNDFWSHVKIKKQMWDSNVSCIKYFNNYVRLDKGYVRPFGTS